MAIDLYSKATTDTLLAGKLSDAPSDGSTYGRKDGAWEVVSGGGGSYLPLAGGTMTGAIVFDGTSGQYIYKGNFDSSRGGNYGISLVCSIGYEFNWQAGWLTTTEQGTTTPRPLYLDSYAGTTLRVWNSGTSTGTEVTHTGITFSDSTTQTTAWTGTIPGKTVNTYSSNFTLSSVDGDQIISLTSTLTVTVPQDSTYSFPIGTIITVCDSNLSGMPGQTFVPEDTFYGIPTIIGGPTTTRRVVQLVKVDANTWCIN